MNLEKSFNDLSRTYDSLRKANEDLLIYKSGQEGFEALIELRNAYFDGMESIRDDIICQLDELKPSFDYISMDLIELVKELPKHYPELTNSKKLVEEALQRLVDSEKNVAEEMGNLKDDLKKNMQQTRMGAKTLNAYKPLSGYSGSHFIDSKK